MKTSTWMTSVWIGTLALGLSAQVPLDQVSAPMRGLVKEILDRSDFSFQTRTKPRKVSLTTMDALFDRPQLSAAMWRHCQFVPLFYAFESPSREAFYVTDTRGLHGTMTLVLKRPGHRIYVAEGRVEKGRMGNPFAVSARMVTVYKYWESPQGFESHLQTWTTLDSALLSFISRPFRSYVRKRQEEFIEYINGNIAQGGEFAHLNPHEFRDPIHYEGEPVAIRQYDEVFSTKKKRNGYR